MKQLFKNIKAFALIILTISFLGCDEDDAKLPEVIAGFTHTISQDTGTVTFINTSENADNYSWDFGDTNSSTEINPIKMYPTGTYTVVLTATNVAGASSTFEDTITIAIPEAITVPFNFDEELVVYEAELFGGTSLFDVVENPDLSGTNSTASNVGTITNSGAQWEGFYFELGAPLDLTTDKTVTMNFWSNVPLDVLVKLEQGNAADTETSASHGGSGWEELIFTFDSAGEYSIFTMFVDGPGMTAGTFYFDDVMQVPTIDLIAPVITLNGDATMDVLVGTTYTDAGATASDNFDGDISANISVGGDTVDVNTVGTYVITYNVSDAAGNAATEVTRTVNVITPPQAPTTAAPTPTHAAADVVSLFSDSYTDVAGINYNPNWGQSGFGDVNTAFDTSGGNLAIGYLNFNYQGMDFAAQDLSSMEFLHVDIWTPDATDLKVTPIGGGETLVSLTPLNTGTWNSYDIPLSDFTAVNLAIVNQFKFDGQGGTNPSNIYVDNLYFYKTAGSGGNAPTTAAPTPTHAAADVVSLFSDSYTDVAGINYNPNWGQSGFGDVNTAFDTSGGNLAIGYLNFNYQGMDFAAQDLSSMEFLHVDIWTPDATDLKVTPIGGGETLVSLTPLNTGTWNSYDIPLSDFTAVNLAIVNQFKFDGQGGVNPSNIYVDNLYFYTTGGGGGGGGGGGYDLTLPIDFEPAGFGAGWAWNVFENDSNPALEFVTNPNASGINTSPTVAKITALQAGNPWVGTETVHGEMGITWDLSASNAIIKIMVYKTVISDVGIKLVNPSGGAQEEIKVANTVINQWEELTFDFTSRIGNGLDGSTNIDQIVVFPDFDLGGRTQDNIVYFDNITFN